MGLVDDDFLHVAAAYPWPEAARTMFAQAPVNDVRTVLRDTHHLPAAEVVDAVAHRGKTSLVDAALRSPHLRDDVGAMVALLPWGTRNGVRGMADNYGAVPPAHYAQLVETGKVEVPTDPSRYPDRVAPVLHYPMPDDRDVIESLLDHEVPLVVVAAAAAVSPDERSPRHVAAEKVEAALTCIDAVELKGGAERRFGNQVIAQAVELHPSARRLAAEHVHPGLSLALAKSRFVTTLDDPVQWASTAPDEVAGYVKNAMVANPWLDPSAAAEITDNQLSMVDKRFRPRGPDSVSVADRLVRRVSIKVLERSFDALASDELDDSKVSDVVNTAHEAIIVRPEWGALNATAAERVLSLAGDRVTSAYQVVVDELMRTASTSSAEEWVEATPVPDRVQRPRGAVELRTMCARHLSAWGFAASEVPSSAAIAASRILGDDVERWREAGRIAAAEPSMPLPRLFSLVR